MALAFVQTPTPATAGSERKEPAAPALIPGWRCIPGAVIRALGQAGAVDLMALDGSRGVALVAFLAEGEEASPEEAKEAFQTMLREQGFLERFAAFPPVVALTVPRRQSSELGPALSRAFDGVASPTVAPDWPDWIADRVLPPGHSASPRIEPLRLLAPGRDEAMPEKAGGIVLQAKPTAASLLSESALAPVSAPAEPAIEVPDTNRGSLLDWGTALGVASGIVLALLAGLAAMLRNGRLF